MAITPNMMRSWYKDLSVAELEEKYKELKNELCFETKEAQIKYIIEHYLNASNSSNNYTECEVLEELLKEKTGKEYKFEEKYFEMTTNDIIDYIVNDKNLLDSKTILVDFFNKLTKVEEDEKILFLFCLVQNDENFNNFMNEIKGTQKPIAVFVKYLNIAESFYSMNHRIG